jgi:hypothetical protein
VTTLVEIFPDTRPLIGMIHLLPLPGSPRYGGDLRQVERQALRDADILVEEGYDGLMVENFGDVPFSPGSVGPMTVAAMTRVAAHLRDTTGLPLGVNVLRNDAQAALAVAVATGATMIRVNVHCGATATDQGVVEGRAHETLRERARLGARVAILADVLVKHGRPIGPDDPALLARDLAERGLADAVLVTGAATGTPVDEERLRVVKAAVPLTPVLIASGLTAKNAGRLAPHADGAIVGTSIKRRGEAGSPVDRNRAKALVAAFREAIG